MDRPKTKEQRAGEAAAAWWRALRPDPDRNHPGDRAALAGMRRIGSVPEALTDPAVMALIRKVAEATEWPLHPKAWWVSPAAIAAPTLAHLRHNGPRPMAEVLGQEVSDDRPRYSGLRFTRLIRAESDQERLTQLGRAARRLRADDSSEKARADIEQLATDIFRFWSQPDDVRRDWTFQYYQMTAAAPKANADTEPLTDEVSR